MTLRTEDAAARLDAKAAASRSEKHAPANGAQEGNAQARKAKLQRLDIARMVRESPPPVPWVIDGLVVRGTLTILNGREGDGKSLLAMALAAGVTLGENQAGMDCHPGRVLIVDTENGSYETHRRVHALGLPATVEVYEPAEGQRFDLRSDLGDLDRLLAAHTPDLLILDSFRTLWGGEENDSGEVAKVLDPLRNLVRRHKAGTILLHHSGKGTGGGYRGSSAIGASAELGFTLAREEGDDDRDRRSLSCWKCRPAPKPAKAWLRLSVERGMVLIDKADAPEEKAEPAQPVVSQLTAAILDAAGEKPATVADLARRVRRDPKDGSVRNALAALERSGEMAKTEEGWGRVQRCKPPRAVAPLHPPAEAPKSPVDTEDSGVQTGVQTDPVPFAPSGEPPAVRFHVDGTPYLRPPDWMPERNGRGAR
jgi:hypothetical protein